MPEGGWGRIVPLTQRAGVPAAARAAPAGPDGAGG
jgi:hypothetical protein